MNNYIFQRQRFDCGPTAIFNALVYFQQDPKISKLKLLRKLCATNVFCNGSPEVFVTYAISLHFKYEFMFFEPARKNKKILRHLKSAPAIVALNIKDNIHVFFVEKYIPETHKIVVVNMFGKYKDSPVSTVKADILLKDKVIAYLLEDVYDE